MKQSYKIRPWDLIWFLTINLVLFQNALMRISPVFRYFDEGLTFFFILIIALSLRRLRREYARFFVLLIILFALGIMGNLTSGIDRSWTMIMSDMFYFSKIYFCLIGSIIYFDKKNGLQRITHALATEIWLITVIGLTCAIVSQAVDIGMTRGTRFGFKAFQFIYSNPGLFGQYCMLYLIILTIDLKNARRISINYFFIILLFFLWFSTGRTRCIAAMMIWCFVWALSNSKVFIADNRYNTKQRLKRLLKPQYIALAFFTVVAIGWDQFQHYFGSEATTARSLLLRGGIAVMRDFFPFGAGFATFGTEMAARNYSPLYNMYGLHTYWGLAEGGSELTDCFWPAVGAEFGVLGILVIGILIWKLFSCLLVQTRAERYGLLAGITYAAYMLISSTGTSIFTAYTSVGFVVVLVGLVTNINKEKDLY